MYGKPNQSRFPPPLMDSPRLLPLLLLLFSATLVATEYVNHSPTVFLSVCGKNKTQNPESFDIDFVDAMEQIYQNISTTGFATSSSTSNFTVYGLGQCFSYLSHVSCQLCYSQSRVKLPHCLPSTAGRIYLDGCFLEYADRDVSSHSVDEYDAFSCSNNTVADALQPRFNTLAAALVENLTAEAYRAEGYYQAASLQVASTLTVYGMAQCWKSLTATGCRECLEKGKQNIVGSCLPADDAKAMNAGCFLRYSTEPFYKAQAADGSDGSSENRPVIIAVIAVLAALVVIGIVVLWWMRRSNSAAGNDNDDAQRNNAIIKSIANSNLSFKYEDLMKATGNFDHHNKLGQGGFGAVYKGVLPNGKEIAVKRLFYNTTNWVDQFFNEVKLINQVQHKNLVKLLGCCVEGPESLLVYEFLSNTSLDKYLFDSFKKTELTWERRLEMIIGTAEGLAYLHGGSVVRIIHRDIKASNILLDEKFRPKISDFGLARNFAEDQSHLSTGLAGTFGYMAPEYIVHGQLTEKADVYSYGVLVLEIIMGSRNQNSILASADGHSLMQQTWQHYNSNTLMTLLDPDLHGCSEEEALKVFKVGLLCVQASPALRPAMWKVVEMLTSRSRELPIPTQPPFLNTHGSQSGGEVSEASYLLSASEKMTESVDQTSKDQISLSILQGR